MINTDQNNLITYPKGIHLRAFESFALTTCFHVAYGEDYQKALSKGAIAALSCTIESVSRPWIQNIFQNVSYAPSIIQMTIPRFTATSFHDFLFSVSTEGSLEISCKTALSTTFCFLRNLHLSETNQASIDIAS